MMPHLARCSSERLQADAALATIANLAAVATAASAAAEAREAGGGGGALTDGCAHSQARAADEESCSALP